MDLGSGYIGVSHEDLAVFFPPSTILTEEKMLALSAVRVVVQRA